MLEQAYAASDKESFLSTLYAGIRSVAHSVCFPKVATAEDAATSLSSQTINETSSEAELVEYNLLLGTIFADFEHFIAKAHVPDSTSEDMENQETGTSDVLRQLANKLSSVCPKVRVPCGRIFEEQEPTFRCKYAPFFIIFKTNGYLLVCEVI